MRLWDIGDKQNAQLVARFQNITDQPYIIRYGASAVLTSSKLIKGDMVNVNAEGHKADDLELIVIHNENLKDLITELYRRAARC